MSDPTRDASAGPPLCSAKGCREVATTDLTWRNPKLHQGGRVKHWVACPAHADGLAEFLAQRQFLISRDPVT